MAKRERAQIAAPKTLNENKKKRNNKEKAKKKKR